MEGGFFGSVNAARLPASRGKRGEGVSSQLPWEEPEPKLELVEEQTAIAYDFAIEAPLTNGKKQKEGSKRGEGRSCGSRTAHRSVSLLRPLRKRRKTKAEEVGPAKKVAIVEGGRLALREAAFGSLPRRRALAMARREFTTASCLGAERLRSETESRPGIEVTDSRLRNSRGNRRRCVHGYYAPADAAMQKRNLDTANGFSPRYFCEAQG
ncbi:hypothetical protein KM043_006426 [Ampulex compressa]|nr:hypothetical protein KM043_006426 [Ampulex compressa]